MKFIGGSCCWGCWYHAWAFFFGWPQFLNNKNNFWLCSNKLQLSYRTWNWRCDLKQFHACFIALTLLLLNATHLAKYWKTINCLWRPLSYHSQIEITVTPNFSFPPLTLVISSFLQPLNLSIHLLFLLQS